MSNENNSEIEKLKKSILDLQRNIDDTIFILKDFHLLYGKFKFIVVFKNELHKVSDRYRKNPLKYSRNYCLLPCSSLQKYWLHNHFPLEVVVGPILQWEAMEKLN